MVMVWQRLGLLLGVATAILVYPVLYIALRCCGLLAVNAGGWHAGCWHRGGRVWLSALGLFTFFQPLLRLEAGLRRLLSPAGSAQETAVSEVVVEVIPMV